MSYYDLDEDNSIFDEPLKIKVEGVELIIKDRDRREFDRISMIENAYEQLAEWAEIKVKEIEHVKSKKVAAALRVIAVDFIGPALANFKPKKA